SKVVLYPHSPGVLPQPSLMTKLATPRANASAEPTSNIFREDRLTRRERAVWVTALFLLGFMALGFAIVSWEILHANTTHLQVLPIGLVILVSLFVAYSWKKSS